MVRISAIAASAMLLLLLMVTSTAAGEPSPVRFIDTAWDVAGGEKQTLATAAALANPDIRILRFNVKTEAPLRYDADQFSREVVAVLGDERSWIGFNDVVLEFVPFGSATSTNDAVDFTLYLASGPTVDRLCRPLPTRSLVSCRVSNNVVLNHARWIDGPNIFHDDFVDKLDVYRRYLINHEVGHRLGHGHENNVPCRPDLYAPVMMQQTGGTRGCAPNGWPRWDRLAVGSGSVPAPPTPPTTPSDCPGPRHTVDAASSASLVAQDPTDARTWRLYLAAFARTPDPAGLRYWSNQLAAGLSLEQAAAHFLASPEMQTTYGELDTAAFVVRLYCNVLGRPPDTAGFAYWWSELHRELHPESLLASFSESAEFQRRSGVKD